MRAHGLPTAPTLYPFGVPVNGFHPQSIGSVGANNPNLRLVDVTRNGLMTGEKRMKNVKEQQRAQKIAELIDELREKMQKSGWSVGSSKSKFNTLSSYVSAFGGYRFRGRYPSHFSFSPSQMC
jgi:hypothetical protein